MSQITQVQTSTGFATVILNQGYVLIMFYYVVGGESVNATHFKVQNDAVVYNNGWNLKLLNWLVDTYQPKPTLKIE